MKGTLIDNKYNDEEDRKLRSSALDGDKKSLEKLIDKHYSFIYNVALKMVLEPADAEDVAQEIIIKLITSLANFKGDATLRTWLYRIVVNHILNMKKRHCEVLIGTFDEYGKALDKMPSREYSTASITPETQVILDETKYSCMAGMLLCLDREQRLIYVLGEIFEIDHQLGAEIFSISNSNYRKKLSRTRHQLVQFMNNKCGLVNKKNPCRCSKKAKAFIDEGIVNSDNLLYNTNYTKKIYELLPQFESRLDDELEQQCAFLFKESPFQNRQQLKSKLLSVIDSDSFKNSLRINWE